MSYFEKAILTFFRYGEKISLGETSDSSLPVRDGELNDLVEELLVQQKLTNQYLAEIIGERLDEDE